MFNYLDQKENNIFCITSKKDFVPAYTFRKNTLEKCFEFAWNMTFGNEGEHRNHRTGGNHSRKNGEIFINAFQGKLGECTIYNKFYKLIPLEKPDFETYGLGKWDKFDFSYNDISLSVKSTAYFGNLLLLERDDWDIEAKYKPNNAGYDYHILTRIFPDGKKIMSSNRLLYSDKVDKDILKDLIMNQNWQGEITGYITNDDLKEIIRNNYILPKRSFLNSKNTVMDAENYYVQAGDLKDISNLLLELKNETKS